MPAWLVPLLIALVNEGTTTLPKIIAIGQANGMTPEEAATITVGYDVAIAQTAADAK